MPNEPEMQGLTEAEFFSLPWGWIGLIAVFVLIGAGIYVFLLKTRNTPSS